MKNFCPDCGKICKSDSCKCGWKEKPFKPAISAHEFFNNQLRSKFKSLPKDQKDFIRLAIKDGFKWQGEDTHHKLPQLGDMTHFEHAYNEYKEMRRIGVDEYRRKAMAAFRRFAEKGMGSIK